MLTSFSMSCFDGAAVAPCDGLSVGDSLLCETLGLVDGVWVRTSFWERDRVGLLLGDGDSEHGKVVAGLEDFLVPLADLPSADFDPLDEVFSLLLDLLEPEVDLHDLKVVDFDTDLDEDAFLDFVDLTLSRPRYLDKDLRGIEPVEVIRTGIDCHLTVDCVPPRLCYCSSMKIDL
jgi:hypothetical protein